MKGIIIAFICLAVLVIALPAVCGSVSTAAVAGSAAAGNVQQKQIEAAQVEGQLFDGVNPDLAYGLREMRLSNEHGNDTIARVAESADRSQTAIAYTTPVSLALVLFIVIGVIWIVLRLGGKQTSEVK